MTPPSSPPTKSHQPMIRPWILILAVLVIITGFVFWWFYRNNSTSPIVTTTAIPTTSPVSSPTVSPTAAPLTYTDNTYNFTFTYPASWGACKTKDVPLADEEITYYINCPTVDQSFAAGDSTQFPGYYSPLAISVYTLAQWITIQNAEGAEKDALLAQNNTYAFGWIQSNGQLPSDWTNKQFNDYQTLINSFKLL